MKAYFDWERKMVLDTRKRSWKTTTAGWLGIGGAIANVAMKIVNGDGIGTEEVLIVGSIISTSVGLLKAKDKDVTGVSK